MKVLWITNDLPPRAGGIEQFVGSLLARVHPDRTVVLGPSGGPDAAEHDRLQPYRTVRAPGSVLPTRRVLRLATEVAARHRPDVIVLGASWPLGELVPGLRRATGGVPVVALSHGLEAGLVQAGGGALVRRATRELAALTTISDWTEARLSGHVRADRLVRLAPGVDVDRFRPDVDGTALRASWGVPEGVSLVGCISRLVPRKGQDVLLRAWPRVLRETPDAWLVLVGEGPLADRLRRSRRRLGAAGRRVTIAGRVSWDELPAAHAALDVFAMPCRTRLAGTDVEGLGIVYLEAQSTGVPVVAGRSGGAPETVVDGVTGTVVDGRDADGVAAALTAWLHDPPARRAAGEHGRAWALERWSWTAVAARLVALLDEVCGAPRPDR